MIGQTSACRFGSRDGASRLSSTGEFPRSWSDLRTLSFLRYPCMRNSAMPLVVTAESRGEYRRIMESLVSQGAQAIILGCTEISLLIGQQDSAVPLFDTTAIHARTAAEEALSE